MAVEFLFIPFPVTLFLSHKGLDRGTPPLPLFLSFICDWPIVIIKGGLVPSNFHSACRALMLSRQISYSVTMGDSPLSHSGRALLRRKALRENSELESEEVKKIEEGVETPSKTPPLKEDEEGNTPDGGGNDAVARELVYQVKKRPFQTWQTRYNRLHKDFEVEMKKKDEEIEKQEEKEKKTANQMSVLKAKLNTAVNERAALREQLVVREKELARANVKMMHYVEFPVDE